MMGSILSLESFDADAARHHHPDVPLATFEDGYAAGFSAAQELHSAADNTLKQEFIQSVTDTAFGYHEAQSHMIAAMTPLLEAMLNSILPETLAPGFHVHVHDMVTKALAIDATAPISLRVPVDQLVAVQGALSDVHAPYLTIVPDSALNGHCAWVTAPDRETALNLDATLRAITDHVATLIASTSQNMTSEAS